VVDSLLQTAPERLALSLLVADGNQPWGSGACPPRGDLRARRDRLLRAADVLLFSGSGFELEQLAIPARRWSFERRLREATRPGDAPLTIEQLCQRRLGLLTTVARPERLLTQLEEAGITIHEHRRGPDHGTVPGRGRSARKPDVEAWLTTAKCATKLGQEFENIPVWVIQEDLQLPPQLLDLLAEKGWISGPTPVLESAPCSVER
jgi:tetraacyldisaccharide-1-P 4'-kinase